MSKTIFIIIITQKKFLILKKLFLKVISPCANYDKFDNKIKHLNVAQSKMN